MQEEPFRKNLEKGRIDISEPPSLDDGKLRNIIRLLCQHNTELAEAFKSAPLNAKYLSHDILSQILDFCLMCVLETVLVRIHKTKCCSVLADEAGRFRCDFLTVIIRDVDETMTLRVLNLK